MVLQHGSPPLRSSLGISPVMKMLVKVETQCLKQKILGFKLLSALCLEFSLCLVRTREKKVREVLSRDLL